MHGGPSEYGVSGLLICKFFNKIYCVDPKHSIEHKSKILSSNYFSGYIGDSEVDAMSAYNAKVPFVLMKDGYTEKTEKEIKHDELISDFVNFEKIIEKYL